MAKTDFKSVDEYISTFPEGVQAILQRVRRTIRRAVPAADEVISYQIPGYKLRGARVIYFAGWKEHYLGLSSHRSARQMVQGETRTLGSR